MARDLFGIARTPSFSITVVAKPSSDKIRNVARSRRCRRPPAIGLKITVMWLGSIPDLGSRAIELRSGLSRSEVAKSICAPSK